VASLPVGTSVVQIASPNRRYPSEASSYASASHTMGCVSSKEKEQAGGMVGKQVDKQVRLGPGLSRWPAACWHASRGEQKLALLDVASEPEGFCMWSVSCAVVLRECAATRVAFM